MRQQPLLALVLDAQPAAVQGEIVRLLFPRKSQFHYERLRETSLPILEQALARILGRAVKVECYLGQLPEGLAPPEPEPAPPAETARPAEEPEPAAPVVQVPTEPEAPAETTAPAPAPSTAEPPARAVDQAVEEAVSETLKLFEGSRELPEG